MENKEQEIQIIEKEKINFKKRKSLKKIAIVVFIVATFGIFSRIKQVKKELTENKEMTIKYDKEGYINKIYSDNKEYKFNKGVLIN